MTESTEPMATPNALRSLVGIIDRPQATLSAIYASPRWHWVLPGLLLIITLVALNLVSAPYTAELSREQIRRQMQALPEEQAALVADQIEQFSSPLFVGLTASATGVIGLIVAIVIAGAVLYFGGLVVGAELDFTPMLTVITWTWAPFLVRNIVEAVWVYLQGGLIINSGLSWLVSVGDQVKDAGNISYFVLSYVQIFVLWHLFLVWAGLRGAGKLSRSKAFILVVIYAVVGLAVRWIPTLISLAFVV
jgi:hypothetical protein